MKAKHAKFGAGTIFTDMYYLSIVITTKARECSRSSKVSRDPYYSVRLNPFIRA